MQTEKVTRTASDVQLIAFYLPQFHPIPENDEWWGKGFTEWRNVATAEPLFPGHYQPHIPADLGFYDLRLEETREAQAELAREHGIHGFCYYYYWFNGRRILERPLNDMLATGKPDFPFCVCWANENWSRLWDGGNNELLLSQEHSLESDIAFIHDVIPMMKDPRYIRVDGKPLLLLYRSDLLKDPKATAEAWRAACVDAGLGGVHLCIVQSFQKTDPREIGFDAACEFPPHQYKVADMTETVDELEDGFRGKVYDYNKVAQHSVSRPAEPYTLYQSLFPGWDNTSRKRKHALVYHGANPGRYEYWLRGLVSSARERLPEGNRLIFVNAWNEWAEGAHLEPDLEFGRGYLEATARALSGETNWRELLELLTESVRASVPEEVAPKLLCYADELRQQLETQSARIEYYETDSAEAAMHRELRHASPFVAVDLKSLLPEARQAPELRGWLESVNGHSVHDHLILSSEATAHMAGWMACEGAAPHSATTRRYLLLRKAQPHTVMAAALKNTEPRSDVASALSEMNSKYTSQAGFAQLFSLRATLPGTYEIGIGLKTDTLSTVSWLNMFLNVTE